jgi:hypothetical protein
VTPSERRLAAVAAVFAPQAAARLLSRAPSAACAEEATRLSTLSRADRIAALSTALADPQPVPPARGPGAPDAERPRLAALLAEVAAGRAAGPGVAPLLLRIVRERLASP